MPIVSPGDLVVVDRDTLVHVVDEVRDYYTWIHCEELPVARDARYWPLPSTAFPTCIQCVGRAWQR